MSLSPRQQAILDQIEEHLQSADPGLNSMFEAFPHSAPAQPLPRAEVILRRSPRLLVIICVILVSAAGVLFCMRSTRSDDCPGPSSNRVVASAAASLAGCSQNSDVSGSGGR